MANYNAIKYDGFSKGSTTLIKTTTISSDVNVDFVNGSSDVVLDSTYKEYMFIFNNIHPSSQGDIFKINFSDDTSSHAYNLSKTTTNFYSGHSEDDSNTWLATGQNLGNATGDQEIVVNINADNDSCCAGFLRLFNPSDTTFVKHFVSNFNSAGESDRSFASYTAGYVNTTAAVTAVRFTFGGSDIDSGTIQLIGIT